MKECITSSNYKIKYFINTLEIILVVGTLKISVEFKSLGPLKRNIFSFQVIVLIS